MPQKKTPKIPSKLQEWVDARNRHRLSHADVQMARELGFLPKSLRKIDDHNRKQWKAPLPQYIAALYLKRFGRERPDVIRSIEQVAADQAAKEALRKASKSERKSGQTNALQSETRTTEDGNLE